MESTFTNNVEGEWTKEEKKMGLTGKTCRVKITTPGNINTGFKKHWFPTRYIIREGFELSLYFIAFCGVSSCSKNWLD